MVSSNLVNNKAGSFGVQKRYILYLRFGMFWNRLPSNLGFFFLPFCSGCAHFTSWWLMLRGTNHFHSDHLWKPKLLKDYQPNLQQKVFSAKTFHPPPHSSVFPKNSYRARLQALKIIAMSNFPFDSFCHLELSRDQYIVKCIVLSRTTMQISAQQWLKILYE